jgi:aminoglycoside phosphotransferase (APT) family kinase protein
MLAPESELEITDGLIARLVEEQHPELAGSVRFVVHGWDCDLYRLGAQLAVRLPRRVSGVEPLLNEQRWLPELAAALPVPVPAPVAVGRPGAGYPWSWSVIPWFEGVAADTVPPIVRDRCAERLGQVVAALHAPAPHDAPVSNYRGTPLRDRDATVRRRVGILGKDAEAALRVWEAGLAARPSPVRSWNHGDLHPANVLLHGDGRDGSLAAVIDFGDLSAGDPAVDLAAAWLFFSPVGRELFRAAVGRGRAYDPEVWQRARAWAVDFSIGLITESDGSARMTSLGRSGLAAALLPD